MPVLPFGETAPDFSDPLGLLTACHGRIQQYCDLLQRLCEHLEQNVDLSESASAAQRVLRYFDIAAPLHHADEEQDLFPKLIGQADLAPLIQRLLAEHEQQEQLWHSLRPALIEIVDQQPNTRLRLLAEPFIEANLAHLALENEQILPKAADLLSESALQNLGRNMAQRRQ